MVLTLRRAHVWVSCSSHIAILSAMAPCTRTARAYSSRRLLLIFNALNLLRRQKLRQSALSVCVCVCVCVCV